MDWIISKKESFYDIDGRPHDTVVDAMSASDTIKDKFIHNRIAHKIEEYLRAKNVDNAGISSLAWLIIGDRYLSNTKFMLEKFKELAEADFKEAYKAKIPA